MSWLDYTGKAGATPRRAAAVIARDRVSDSVLLVKRNPALAFMGGHHAFPGGALSSHDRGGRVRPEVKPDLARLITAGVREVFEETGLLLVSGTMPDADTLHRARGEILEHPSRFESFLESRGLYMDAGEFMDAGHWITPSFAPMRFDTQYFFRECEGRASVSPGGPRDEIVAAEWMGPKEALRQRRQGALVLSTPPAFVLQRLAAFPPAEALPLLRETPGFSNTLLQYIEPLPGVHLVPLPSRALPPATHTNCVLIGDSAPFVVDPGAGDREEQDRFMAHLETVFRVANAQPAGVLLTHNDSDHAAMAPMIAAHYGVPIYGHASTVAGLERGKPLTEPEGGLESPGNPPWRIRALHTPGHYPGHYCYLEETTGVLLCGDMAANQGTIMIDPDRGGDMTAYLQSLDYMAALSPVLTVPGHGQPLLGAEGPALFERLRSHRLRREAAILEACDAGADTYDALLERAYADTPRALWPYALRQLRAHLIRLGRRAGKLDPRIPPMPSD